MSAVRLNVYVQPGASRTAVAGMHDGAIKIRVAARAVDNAANRALVDFVAHSLGIARSRVVIVSGSANRRKVLQIEGVSKELIESVLRS
jgi:hypothetical protein